ncbi:MAG: hypothetical protein ABSB68_01800 [Acidimicrobiales bacterium]
MIVVDDALLLAILAEQQGAAESLLITAAEAGEVFTTGSWFWRLARVVARPGQGALSRALAASSEDEQRRVYNALDQLPAEIGLLSMRRLVPVMAALPGQLNLLTAEAVAAAVVLGARIAVSTESRLLTAAASSVDIRIDVVHLGS